MAAAYQSAIQGPLAVSSLLAEPTSFIRSWLATQASHHSQPLSQLSSHGQHDRQEACRGF